MSISAPPAAMNGSKSNESLTIHSILVLPAIRKLPSDRSPPATSFSKEAAGTPISIPPPRRGPPTHLQAHRVRLRLPVRPQTIRPARPFIVLVEKRLKIRRPPPPLPPDSSAAIGLYVSAGRWHDLMVKFAAIHGAEEFNWTVSQRKTPATPLIQTSSP